MSHSSQRPSNPIVPFASLTALLALALASTAPGQVEPDPIPAGWIVVDDMVLPGWALQGEASYNGTLWPGGTIPYDVGSLSSANATLAVTAMAEWEAVADIDFVLRTTEANYIRWLNSTVNQSPIGMIGGRQDVQIVSWATKYTLCHELCHAMSAIHEHMRPNRDTYVTIGWANVSQTACGGSCDPQFQLISSASTVGAYDFLSIMHYSGTAWSTGGNTITCNAGYTSFQSQIGNRAYMTFSDALGMQYRYGAPSPPVLTYLSQTWAIAGSAGFTLTVYGSRFFQGSPNTSGVQGSRVRWNGIELPTTYVSPTQLTATVGAGFIAGSSCNQIWVDNAYPGGGASNAMDFTTGPVTTLSTSWFGTAELSQLGTAVAALGDVNDDGRDDVLIGEPGYDGGRGRAWCFSGADGSMIWSATGLTGDVLGSAVAAAGDLNGDGKSEALVGVPGSSSGAGSCRVLNGANGTGIRTHSGSAGDRFGTSVANAGDIDADGTPDHVIGAPGWSGDTGRARVVTGDGSTVIYTVTGAAAGDEFGRAVAGGYDIDGGGRPDFVVGAPKADGGGTDRGRVYLYAGGTGGMIATKTGDGDYDRLGIAVAMAPSITGQNGGCFLAGADEYGSILFGGGAEEGYVRVFGCTGIACIVSSAFTTLATWHGESAGDLFGAAICHAGDIDQDGFPDIVVGAPQGTLAFGGNGFVRVVSGRSGDVRWEESGTEPFSLFGRAVAAGFNQDGDSLADVLAGAPSHNNGSCGFVGQARVFEPLFPPSQRKVMLTEVTWGEPEGVEITNFDTAGQSLAGWTVQWDDGATVTSSALNVTVAAGESVVVTEPGGVFAETPAGVRVLTALPALSTSAGDITVALVNNNGMVVDEVRVSDSIGNHAEGSLGGLFRGIAGRGSLIPGYFAAVERIWGLDSNSGGDWTAETLTSMGLENRSSGNRGSDPIAIPTVVINEIDDNPDQVELRLQLPVDLRNWFLLASGAQGATHSIVRPWPDPGIETGYVVIGEGSPPSELPAGSAYVDITAHGDSLPWTTAELDCALYDAYGRIVDLLRTTGHDDHVVHNHPRAPSYWSDFGGATGRNDNGGDRAIGRDESGTDTDAGADFRPVFIRTMGSANPAAAMAGPAGLGDPFDVRWNETGLGGGLAIIINAGTSHSGHIYSFFYSVGHASGQGPFLGLGLDALANWFAIYGVPPWTGSLNFRGSARIDLPPATLPAGLDIDAIFILQNPAGGLVLQTKVLEFDT